MKGEEDETAASVTVTASERLRLGRGMMILTDNFLFLSAENAVFLVCEGSLRGGGELQKVVGGSGGAR